MTDKKMLELNGSLDGSVSGMYIAKERSGFEKGARGQRTQKLKDAENTANNNPIASWSSQNNEIMTIYGKERNEKNYKHGQKNRLRQHNWCCCI